MALPRPLQPGIRVSTSFQLSGAFALPGGARSLEAYGVSRQKRRPRAQHPDEPRCSTAKKNLGDKHVEVHKNVPAADGNQNC